MVSPNRVTLTVTLPISDELDCVADEIRDHARQLGPVGFQFDRLIEQLSLQLQSFIAMIRP